MVDLKNKEKVTQSLSLAAKLVALAMVFNLAACEKCGSGGDSKKIDVNKVKIEFEQKTISQPKSNTPYKGKLKITNDNELELDPETCGLKYVLVKTEVKAASGTASKGEVEVGGKKVDKTADVSGDLKEILKETIKKGETKQIDYTLTPGTADDSIELTFKLKGKDGKDKDSEIEAKLSYRGTP